MGGRLQLKCDGTRWRRGGEVKGNLANGMVSQYSSHYLGTWCIQHYYRWCRTPRLPVVDWTDASADLNGLVRFAERRNLVSARVPSHFNWPLLPVCFRKVSGSNPTPAGRFFVVFPSPSWKMSEQCLILAQTRFVSHLFRFSTHCSPYRMPYSLADCTVWKLLDVKSSSWLLAWGSDILQHWT